MCRNHRKRDYDIGVCKKKGPGLHNEFSQVCYYYYYYYFFFFLLFVIIILRMERERGGGVGRFHVLATVDDGETMFNMRQGLRAARRISCVANWRRSFFVT